MLLMLTAAAYAQDTQALIAQAQEALVSGDIKTARQLLDAAEEALAAPEDVVDPAVLGALWLYQGAAAAGKKRRIDKALADWRVALRLHPAQALDAALFPGIESADLFEALRREVTSRTVPSGLPEAGYAVAVFIDGLEPDPIEPILDGEHLVQVRCPQSGLRSQWVSPPIAWGTLCPEGLEAAEEEDAMEAMMPSFSD